MERWRERERKREGHTLCDCFGNTNVPFVMPVKYFECEFDRERRQMLNSALNSTGMDHHHGKRHDKQGDVNYIFAISECYSS